jgi:hypothetical protein
MEADLFFVGIDARPDAAFVGHSSLNRSISDAGSVKASDTPPPLEKF